MDGGTIVLSNGDLRGCLDWISDVGSLDVQNFASGVGNAIAEAGTTIGNAVSTFGTLPRVRL